MSINGNPIPAADALGPTCVDRRADRDVAVGCTPKDAVVARALTDGPFGR